MEGGTSGDFCTWLLKTQDWGPLYPLAVLGPRPPEAGGRPRVDHLIIVRLSRESERGQPRSPVEQSFEGPGQAGAGLGGIRANACQIPPTVAEKTKEQANAVSEAVVSSVNTVATKTVEEVENIAVTSGVVHKVRSSP